MLSVRFRVNLESGKKALFIGLGRSGLEYDFTSRQSSICLIGKHIKTIESKEKKPKKTKPSKKSAKAKIKKTIRKRALRDFLKIIPKSSKAFGSYLLSILKSVVVEEMKGEIKAGFESPYLTGQVFGYYQAVIGAVPSMTNRLIYVPVWDEELFEASFKASVAIPFYKIVYRTFILIVKLPLRDIIKLTIGKKERRP